MAGNEIEKCDDGKNFQYVVLKVYVLFKLENTCNV